MGSPVTGRARRPAARGAAPEHSAGFTLIELVIVVAVLSVLAVGAGLVASRSGRAAEQSDLQRFRQQFETVRARAIQGRQALGIKITAKGFRGAHQAEQGWVMSQQENRWRGRAVLQSDGPRQDTDAPDIILLSNGRSSAFTLSFFTSGARRARCVSDGFSGLTCDEG